MSGERLREIADTLDTLANAEPTEIGRCWLRQLAERTRILAAELDVPSVQRLISDLMRSVGKKDNNSLRYR